MRDIQGFATKKDAKDELAKMRGWNAKVSLLFLPEHPLHNRHGNVWVIECKVGRSDPIYLRTDGYVR